MPLYSSRKRKYSRVAKTVRRYKSRRAATTRRPTFATRVRRVILRTGELKSKHSPVTKVEIFHNSFNTGGYVLKLNSDAYYPTQGVAQNQRVGDEIMLSGIGIKLLIGQKADRPNVTFRWAVITLPRGATINYASVFQAVTNNVLIDDFNKDFATVKSSGLWRPNEAGLNGTGGDEYTFVKKVYVPWKHKTKFGPANGASTQLDTQDLYFIMVAYDAYGSITGTDNIAYAESLVTVYYRDP